MSDLSDYRRLVETDYERFRQRISKLVAENEQLKRQLGFEKIKSISSYLTNRHINHIDDELSGYYGDAVNAIIDHIRLFVDTSAAPADGAGEGGKR